MGTKQQQLEWFAGQGSGFGGLLSPRALSKSLNKLRYGPQEKGDALVF